MAITKKTNVTAKTAPKFFTDGKPKDFTFTSEVGGGVLTGRITDSGKGYVISTTSSFCSKGLRELSALLEELAGIADGSIAA